MVASERTFAPEGWPRVSPRIVVRDVRRFVGFAQQVFGATGDYEETRPTTLWIGESPLMISEAGARQPMPAFLYVYVADTDAVFGRAAAAGARVIEAPFDTPYGDRRGMVEDEWGNHWQIATHRRAACPDPSSA